MADSMGEMVWSAKYWQQDWEIQPSSSGRSFYKILRWSEEKRQLGIQTGFASGDASTHRQATFAKNYSVSIISGLEFKKSQETLNSKEKLLWY